MTDLVAAICLRQPANFRAVSILENTLDDQCGMLIHIQMFQVIFLEKRSRADRDSFGIAGKPHSYGYNENLFQG